MAGHAKIRKPPPDTPTRRTQIERAISEFDDITTKALAAGSFSAAVQSRSRQMAAEVELRQLDYAERIDATTDALTRVQLARSLALESASMAAASDLLRQEREIVTAREAAEAARLEAERMATDPNEARRMVVETLRALPPEILAGIREELGW